MITVCIDVPALPGRRESDGGLPCGERSLTTSRTPGVCSALKRPAASERTMAAMPVVRQQDGWNLSSACTKARELSDESVAAAREELERRREALWAAREAVRRVYAAI